MIDLAARLAKYTAALNQYDLDAVEQMFADAAIYASPGVGGEIAGHAAIMAAFHAYFARHSDQVNSDENVRQLDEYTLEARWRLISSNSTRSGLQRIGFNAEGLIARVDVVED